MPGFPRLLRSCDHRVQGRQQPSDDMNQAMQLDVNDYLLLEKPAMGLGAGHPSISL